MTRRVALVAIGVVVLVGATLGVVWKMRGPREDPAAVRQAIATLEAEREQLREQLAQVVARDPRLQGAPNDPIRLGVPTSLVRELVASLVTGVADRVTIELGNLHVRRQGQVRRMLPVGEYDLHLTVNRVVARLKASMPDLTFGGNQIRAVMPVRVSGGSGAATVDFNWDGRMIAGAVCGDMHVIEQVAGTVKPSAYKASATVRVAATDSAIVLTPKISPLRLKIQVEPSKASWARLRTILDAKGGLCGFVVDRVNILGSLEALMAKGFTVRVPVERITPVTLPVGIEPAFSVRGERVQLGLRAADLLVTPDMIWLGVAVYSRHADSSPGASVDLPSQPSAGRRGSGRPAGER